MNSEKQKVSNSDGEVMGILTDNCLENIKIQKDNFNSENYLSDNNNLYHKKENLYLNIINQNPIVKSVREIKRKRVKNKIELKKNFSKITELSEESKIFHSSLNNNLDSFSKKEYMSTVNSKILKDNNKINEDVILNRESINNNYYYEINSNYKRKDFKLIEKPAYQNTRDISVQNLDKYKHREIFINNIKNYEIKKIYEGVKSKTIDLDKKISEDCYNKNEGKII